jgi:murein L,D-transpeptidase YcbB/YkuD
MRVNHFLPAIGFIFVFAACNHKSGKTKNTIAATPQQLQAQVADYIKSSITDAAGNSGKLTGLLILTQPRVAKLVYEKNNFIPLWCREQRWLPAGDSLFAFIDKAKLFGLFPEDYHVKELTHIRDRFNNDSLARSDRNDVSLWATADMMLTDAFVQLINDVKLGRLPNDSVTLRKDSVLSDSFYLARFIGLMQQASVSQVIQSIEPRHQGYQLLKKGVQKFLDSASYRQYTNVPLPGNDPVAFKKNLQQRLFEEGFIAYDSVAADSASLADAVKKFQQKKGIAVDGRVGEGTIRMLNDNDRERFIRIAISLDKYKMLPEKMPAKYVWVNIPGYNMQLIEGDSARISSKVIIGKPKTRTPVLSSHISQLITYPQWVPPTSIITKEILPAVKKDTGYLASKGFSLLDSMGEEVDPYTVDWSEYSKKIPFRVVQGSGEANALGIMKFVFPNKYAVYLHDTNQRYLFGQTMRSLSHGCVRVQEWEKLAYYLLRNGSINAGRADSGADSVKTWLRNKQKRSVSLKSKMPIFIRYITCEGTGDGVIFYDDIYGDDKGLREKYFASK